MTITAAGFAGTVTEAQWSGINGSTPHAEGSGWGCSAFTTNNLPQVQVAAGYINGQGVRAYNDAPALVTLTAPGAGGAWYLIAARRTWSPTATVALVAIAGTTTGSTTVPIAPPSAFPAALSNTPGTVADQPLAWAFVAAGSTVATVFDARLQRTGAGVLLVPSLQALQAYYSAGSFSLGATVSVAQFTTAGGYTVRPSAWRLSSAASGTYWRPAEQLRVSTAAALTDLRALVISGSFPNVAFFNNDSRAMAEDSGVIYLNVTVGTTMLGGAWAWQAWEKPPTAYAPTFTALTGATTTAFWGINAGVVWATAEVVSASGYALTGGTDVSVSLPTPVLAAMSNGRGTYYRGGVTNNGSDYDLVCFVPGPFGTAGVTGFRIRVNVQSGTAAGAPVSQNMLGNQVLSPYTGDRFQVEIHAPSALVA